ncbi:hypothetical protein A8F94_22735 [Bacillus sp. FJAT-27225]|uniref:hypothetical protein n=1 Tax=Bacillus sp. FJAT-27225 TaxID=1743144 RepID=UPI00080C3334|nr:hypothetical protein [Bacillus sp. FJAT-27225]OCA81677.1 hypothetical protein A8F94_22735 [Bacillus sp. FJAT-27225]
MSIKEIFNPKSKKDEHKTSAEEIEKLTLRMNTFEVNMKSLLTFEKQVRSSMLKKEKPEINRKPHSDTEKRKVKDEGEIGFEKRITDIIEGILSEKTASYREKEQRLQEKVQSMEKLLSALLQRENRTEMESSIRHRIRFEQIREESSESEGRINEAFLTLNGKITAIENNLLLVNEVQAGLLRKMDELSAQYQYLINNTSETPESPETTEQRLLYKTLYIDKVYLDKYEQNNTFGQLGINQLSGALNIGATYGKDAIPNEVTEKLKEDIQNMKAEKEEMAKNEEDDLKTIDDGNADETVQDDSFNSEEEASYCDIEIEEDPPW